MLGWLPEDVSPYGAGIDALFYFIYYLTAAAFIIVTALMLIFLYVYRDRGGRRAAYTHGNTAMEIIWTVIPAVIFIALGLVSRTLWEEIKLEPPETDTVVKVTGKQFNWEVLYPGPDGEFDTADDKQIDNDIRVPAGKPIRVILASKDVIHSFFMPNLRFKQDMVPGREIIGWFQANKPGKYEIPCAELCGFGHSGMKGWLYALAPEEYQAWRNEQWPQAASPNGAAARNGKTETDSTERSAPLASVMTAGELEGAAAIGGISQTSQVVPDTILKTTKKTSTAATHESAEGASPSVTEAAQNTLSGVQGAADRVHSALTISAQATQAAAIAGGSVLTDPAVQMPGTEIPKTQSPQETPAEQFSPDTTSQASGQDSSTDAFSNISSWQHAFTATAVDQSGSEAREDQLEILSGATTYKIAGKFCAEDRPLLQLDLIRDYDTHIINLDDIYPGQKRCIPGPTPTTRLRQEQERGSSNVILGPFRCSQQAKALAWSVQQKAYLASVVRRRVSNSVLLQPVKITDLQDQTTAGQAGKLFSRDDLS